jgi:cytochrome c biogenesis protein CcdA/thiol-disulfide isomerase/thioredoxin
VIFFSGGAQGARTGTPDSAPATGRRPYLVVVGLVLSFTICTLAGTLLLRALHVPQDLIRWAGLIALVLLGLAMMIPWLERLLERPFARIPRRPVNAGRGGFALGLALGAVFVPCAGPVLAAITVAGATGKIGGRTLLLTSAFAIGTAIPLLGFALAGRKLAERLRVFREHQRAIRVGAGAVVLALAVALTFNITDVIQRAVPDYTSPLSKSVAAPHDVADALGSEEASSSLADCAQAVEVTEELQNCGTAPQVSGIAKWLNTPGGAAIGLGSLRGKVVLVDFWAYSCINCQRAIAHTEAWYSAYRNAGFEVIGVHTPEYAFEQVPGNVAAGAKRLGITYPIALDNAYVTWNNYANESWPAEYLIDAKGVVRHVAIGEGNYTGTETLIRSLLTAAKPGVVLPTPTQVADRTPTSPSQTAEIYLGSARADHYAGDANLANGTATFHSPPSVPEDGFVLSGRWSVDKESVTARRDAAITLNFDADKVYLDVGGTGTVTATVGGKTTTYRVSGAPNIYPVVDRQTPKRDMLRLKLSPGLSAYSFTFG